MGLQTLFDSDMSSMGSKSGSESESSCDTIVTKCNIKPDHSDASVNVNCSQASSAREQLILSASKLCEVAHNSLESCRTQTPSSTKIATEVELSQNDKATQAESCSHGYLDNEIVANREQCKNLHSSPHSKRMQTVATSMQIKPANQFDSPKQARGFTETEPKLVCVSQRLEDYFESLKSRRQDNFRSLYQFFKSVRTELVASLLFALITSQALIALRSSNLFRSSDEVSKFHRLDTSHKVPNILESLVPSWDRAGVQMSFGLVLSLTVATMTQIFGHVSGCHLAPSVSLALYVKGHISAARLGSYVLAQSAGPLLGLTILSLLTSSHLDERQIDAILARRTTTNHSNDMKLQRIRRQVPQNYDIQELERIINNSDLDMRQTSYQVSRPVLFDVNNHENASLKRPVSGEKNGAKSGENLMITKNLSDRKPLGDQSRISGQRSHSGSINATLTEAIEGLLMSIENHADELSKTRHKLASSTQACRDRAINSALPESNANNTTMRPSSKIANQSAMIASWVTGQDGGVPVVEAERAITILPTALTITTTTDSEIAASQVVGEIEFNNSHKQPTTGSEKVVGASSIADRERALNFAINADATTQSVTTQPRIKRPRKPSKQPLSNGSVYQAPPRLKAPGDSATQLEDSKHDARSGEHLSSISNASIQTVSTPKLQIRRSAVLDASSNRSHQASVFASKGLPGNQTEVDSKLDSINLLELALPDSIMPTDTMSQCISAAYAKNSADQRDSASQPAKLSTGSGSGIEKHPSLFNMCLSRTNSSQMFVYQFLATLVIVLAYLVNVDPRRVDVGFRSLSIGLAYFVANILTIHSGGFYANPFQLVWLVILSSSSYGEWRSEWFVYMICPLVAGLFGAMSHDYIDFTSTRNRNRTLHMRRSFFSLDKLNSQSTNRIEAPNDQARACSNSASQPQQQQKCHSIQHQIAEIRAANGKRRPSLGPNTSRSISIDSSSSSVYSLVVLGDGQIERPSDSTIDTSYESKRAIR